MLDSNKSIDNSKYNCYNSTMHIDGNVEKTHKRKPDIS